jgi:phenylpropionate dioxygenase-like ring-hydroxylating dioxygenase large terminal subunit
MSQHPTTIPVDQVQPIPLAWYFDPEVLEAERGTLFAQGPAYAGHVGMLDGPGSYAVLPASDDRLLVRDGQDVHLLSNVCSHRGATMLQGRGTVKRITCPFHCWSYDLSGRLTAAPQFDHVPCAPLLRYPLQQWKGLLFAGCRDVAADLAAVDDVLNIDEGDYVLQFVETEHVPVNWKLYQEVFLDNLHVSVIHPSFRRFVDCAEVAAAGHSTHGQRFSLQAVPPAGDLQRSGSASFERWQSLILQAGGGVPPEFAAVWLLYYPNVMIEWYPFMLTISTYHPITPEQTAIVAEYYFDRHAAAKFPELPAAAKLCLDEVQAEDDALTLALARGRKTQWASGDVRPAVWHPSMEHGLARYHRWLREQLGQCCPGPQHREAAG